MDLIPQTLQGFSKILFGLALLAIGTGIGAFGSISIKEGYDNLIKQSAIKRLDGYSLGLLEQVNGLMFARENLDIGTMRHLINLDLIATEVFPSRPVTFGYYLTDEGRNILSKKLKRELYPKIFCDMIRIRYWEGYPTDFIKEKEVYRKKYNISWNDSWKIFDKLIHKVYPNQNEKDAVTLFESYLPGKAYDAVMRDLVIPWLEGIKQK